MATSGTPKATSGREPSKQERRTPPSIVSAISGAISGGMISACVQPLDVLRTRLQADAAAGVVRSTVGALQVVVAESGVRGLWAGTGPTVIRLSMGAALHFSMLEQIKRAIQTHLAADTSQVGPLTAAVSGGLARALAAAVLCPVTVVKTRMEYVRPGMLRYDNTLHAMTSIARVEGLGGLYRGLWPTILTNAPFSAFHYMFYTQLKQAFHQEGRSQTFVNFSTGIVAAMAATLLTQPTDVIRTNMQLNLAGGASSGAWATLRTLMARQGLPGFFIGVTPRLIRRPLQTALMWTLYEEFAPRLTRFMGYDKLAPPSVPG